MPELPPEQRPDVRGMTYRDEAATWHVYALSLEALLSTREEELQAAQAVLQRIRRGIYGEVLGPLIDTALAEVGQVEHGEP